MNSILFGKTVWTEGLECTTHFIVDPGLVLRIAFWESNASGKFIGSCFHTGDMCGKTIGHSAIYVNQSSGFLSYSWQTYAILLETIWDAELQVSISNVDKNFNSEAVAVSCSIFLGNWLAFFSLLVGMIEIPGKLSCPHSFTQHTCYGGGRSLHIWE